MKKAKAREMIELLFQAGSGMSNICFNGKQNEHIPENYRENMRVSQEVWDMAKNSVQEWMKSEGMN